MFFISFPILPQIPAGYAAPCGILDAEMETAKYISAQSEVCHGKPCFRGTRILVATVLELLEAGQSQQEILQAYPGLTIEHIRAALHLASQLLAGEQILSLHSP